jgi:hypothetical protein
MTGLSLPGTPIGASVYAPATAVALAAAAKTAGSVFGLDKSIASLYPPELDHVYMQLAIESGITTGMTYRFDMSGKGTRNKEFPKMGRVNVGLLDNIQGPGMVTPAQALTGYYQPGIIANSFKETYEEMQIYDGAPLDYFGESVHRLQIEHVVTWDQLRLLETIRGARTAARIILTDANNVQIDPTTLPNARFQVRDGISDNSTATGAMTGWTLLTQDVVQGHVGGTAVVLPTGKALDPVTWTLVWADAERKLIDKQAKVTKQGIKIFMRSVVYTSLYKTPYFQAVKFEQTSQLANLGEAISFNGMPAYGTALLPDPNDVGSNHFLSSPQNGYQYNTALEDARCLAVFMKPNVVREGYWFDMFTQARQPIPGVFQYQTTVLSSIGTKAYDLPGCIAVFAHATDTANAAAITALLATPTM